MALHTLLDRDLKSIVMKDSVHLTNIETEFANDEVDIVSKLFTGRDTQLYTHYLMEVLMRT